MRPKSACRLETNRHGPIGRAPFAVLVLVLAALPVPARPIYDIGGGPLNATTSATVREVMLAVARAGMTMPSASFPISDSELAAAAELAVTSEEPELIGIDPAAFPRAILSIDSRITFEAALGGVPDALGFQDRLQQIEPLVDLALSLGIVKGPAVWIRGEMVPEYYRFHVFNLPDPRPYNPGGIENNRIQGYLFLPFGWGSASIGRQSVHLGEPGMSSLMVSDRVQYLDSVVTRTLMGPLKLTHVIATIENEPATPDVSGTGSWLTFGNHTILYGARYYEWWFGTLRLASGSQVLIARRDNAFQIADVLPVFSWHDAWINPNNLSITFDLSWQIIPAVGIFASAGLDEVNITSGDISDSGPPTAAAGILGVRWTPPDADLMIIGEIGSTHYLWGSYYDDQDLLRAVWRRFADVTPQSMPLTSPYGPGASWASFDASWFPLEELELTADALGIIWDPRADLYGGSFAYFDQPAWPWPWMVRASVGASYNFPWGFSAHLKASVESEDGATDWGIEIGGAWGYHQRTEIPGPFAR